MSITRINNFQAQEGKENTLRDLINSFVPMIKSSEGCQSCQVLQNHDDPAQIVVIEVWDSVETHQASAKNAPPEALQEAMQLLAMPPKGAYYKA
ncbi:MAG: putative quinol monooxygenase [bacterium]